MTMQAVPMDERLTNTQKLTFKSCNRKGYLAFVAGIRRDSDSPALTLGSAFHFGLDEKAIGKTTDQAIQSARDYFSASEPSPQNEARHFDWEIDREVTARLLSAYWWRWEEADRDIEILGSEETFERPIINPETNRPSRTFVSAGKIDKRIRERSTRRVGMMEHKTTSSDIEPGSDYWRRLMIDSQISDYFMAGDFQFILYDVIRKPTIRPSQIPLLDSDGCKIVTDADGQRVFNKDGKPRQSADAKQGWTLLSRTETPEKFGDRLTDDIGKRPDFYFARREIARTAADLEEAKFDNWATANMIRESHRLNRWPKNTSHCLSYGKCPYFDLCTSIGMPEAGQPLPAGYKYVSDVHQELADPNA